jgi:hypothetical protein
MLRKEPAVKKERNREVENGEDAKVPPPFCSGAGEAGRIRIVKKTAFL